MLIRACLLRGSRRPSSVRNCTQRGKGDLCDFDRRLVKAFWIIKTSRKALRIEYRLLTGAWLWSAQSKSVYRSCFNRSLRRVVQVGSMMIFK